MQSLQLSNFYFFYLRVQLWLLEKNPLSQTQFRSPKVQFPLGVHCTGIFVDLPSLARALSGHRTSLVMFVADELT